MSDKNLSELEWKKFSKGKGWKDAAFVKALAALETGRTPQARLDALDEIDRQAELLRKAAKADKELGSYLDETGKAAGRERKLQELEARKAARQQEAADDEEETPALLTSKMIPLLRQVRKGEAMQALVAIAGNQAAVLLSRRAVSPARRKLLTDHLGVSGGVKFAQGEAIWEEKAVTFVLKTQAAGLAKKLKAALLDQTGQRTKVRVRGEDPNDIDDDGEPPELDADDAQAAVEAAPAASAQGVPAQAGAPAAADEAAAFNRRLAALVPQAKAALAAGGAPADEARQRISEAGVAARQHEFGSAQALLDAAEALLRSVAVAPAEASAEAVRYQQRLAGIEPRLQAALRADGPEAARLRAVFGYVGEQAAAGDHGKALVALQRLEAMLDAAPGAPGGGRADTAGYRRSLIDYRAAADEVKRQIAALHAAIPGHVPEDADLAEELAGALTAFNDELLALVDAATGEAERNAAEAASPALQARLAGSLAALAADPLIRHVDRNPYGLGTGIERTLGGALQKIRDAMPALS